MAGDTIVQEGYRITGRVQGVFFRAWTRDTARELGLGGNVRNLPDGSVEAHVVGPVGLVETMKARFWEGPPGARVEGVEVLESNQALLTGSFEILY